jgi:hypothetical protein
MTFEEATIYMKNKSHLNGTSLNNKDTIQMLFVAPTLENNELFHKYLEHLFKHENVQIFSALNNITNFDVYVSYTNIRTDKTLAYESLTSIMKFLES